MYQQDKEAVRVRDILHACTSMHLLLKYEKKSSHDILKRHYYMSMLCIMSKQILLVSLKNNWLSIKVTNTVYGPLSLWTEYECTVVLNTCVPLSTT